MTNGSVLWMRVVVVVDEWRCGYGWKKYGVDECVLNVILGVDVDVGVDGWWCYFSKYGDL